MLKNKTWNVKIHKKTQYKCVGMLKKQKSENCGGRKKFIGQSKMNVY